MCESVCFCFSGPTYWLHVLERRRSMEVLIHEGVVTFITLY